ncbi:MAG: haloalkane dehalogenase [Dehalococcoidia bacterium]|nr:haloalkane dehalogenase [Dehalococcoidia bacterium]
MQVLDKKMAYVEIGKGAPIVFQHGNPTSSYLWRNIMPHLKSHGRCIAIDLIGMGDSDKLDNSGPDRYTFFEHRRYLDAALDTLEINNNVTLVLHDWGSALGFDWANRHRDSIKGIAYMEALTQPIDTWDEWPENARNIFQALRSPAGEELVLEKNIFVERILPRSILRDLTEKEMEQYRLPYTEPGESRRPTLSWPRQIPVAGEPAEIVALVRDYGLWLAASDVPKLFINADPGSILIGAQREFCRSWPNQREVTVAGAHFIQEDSPIEIGQAIADWVLTL